MFTDTKSLGTLALASWLILMAGIPRAYAQRDWCIGRVCRIVAPEPGAGDRFGSAIVLSESQGELLLAVGAPDDGRGSVQLFRRSGDGWLDAGRMRSPAGNMARDYGASISISGTLMLVGDGQMTEPRGLDNVGETYVYRRFGVGWIPDYAQTRGWRWYGSDEENSHFGHSVSIHDYNSRSAIAVVGEPGPRLSGGMAYVFKRWVDQWGTVHWLAPIMIKPPGLAGYAEFGNSVACSAEFFAVGAPGDADAAGLRSGSVYVYVSNAQTYSKLNAWDAPPNDIRFGNAVAMTDRLIVAGAPGDNGEAGAAYVFRHNGNAWEPEQKLTGSGVAGDRFGESVAVSGDMIAIGAPEEDGAAGNVYIFQYDGSGWHQEPSLTAFDPADDDMLGAAVAVAGDVVAAGAPLSRSGTESGVVYAFDGVPFAYGDSDLDGVFGMADLNTLFDWVLGREPRPEPGTLRFTLSDVNGDGSIDWADMNLYVDRILWRINCFPVEQPCGL